MNRLRTWLSTPVGERMASVFDVLLIVLAALVIGSLCYLQVRS